VSTYTIGEVADRSGFSASSLRYYEGIGLVAPAARTDAGYRLYDARTLNRLAFIARAKRLGCSLDEIADLADLADGDRCGPVQRRFHELVSAKVAEAQRQVAELVTFTAELNRAAAQLAGPAVDGPCSDGCVCLADGDPVAAAPQPVELAARIDDVPVACSLDPGAVAERVEAWRSILDHARSRTATGDGGLRVELDDDVPAERLTVLAAAEQRCCPFFAFSITVDERGVGLEVRAPDGAANVVAAMFGLADREL
jgi:MerR family transcriptional regulator, copper efflux regulator